MVRSRHTRSPAPAFRPAPPDDTSSLAKLYAPSLSRLLDLSGEFDKLDSDGLDLAQLQKLILRVLRALEGEKTQLALIDCSVKTLLQCRAGQRGIIQRAKTRREMQIAAASSYPDVYRRVAQGAVIMVLARHIHYGMELPFQVSEEEIAVVTRYLETPPEPAQLPRPRRSDTDASRLAAPSPPLGADLTRVLSEPEPDVIEVRLQLEAVTNEILRRTERLSEEPGKREGRSQLRIRAALKLELQRAELVSKCIAGILRCFGGQQRLRIEAEWRRSDEAESFADPEFERVVEHLTDRFLERTNGAPSQRDD
jgi:hypothetical protein